MMKLDLNRCWIQFLCLTLPFVWAPVVTGDEPPSRNARDLMGTHPGGPRRVVGLSETTCVDCHGRAKPASNQELASDIGNRSNDGWILRDEILTWKDHDPHYQAFTILLGDQSKLIAKHLGIVDPQGASLVHRDRRCLSCHSSIPVEQMKLQGDLVQEETHRNPRYTIGVSCEACHGPAGRRADGAEGWGAAHARPRDQDDPDSWWRTLSPQRKFEDFGYWDVHSTRTQTRVCLSCHVGNVEQQKVITHEMYAAGHPPLPGFELSQFVHQMPRHWRRLDEKNKPVRDAFVERSNQLRPKGDAPLVVDPDEVAVTKATMIAALVTLEESMHLTADLIDRSPAPGTPIPAAAAQWPELANYACFACHHELQRDGWRQLRRLTATPGRPTLHEWPLALSRVVAATLQENDAEFQFQAEIDGVAAALNSRPYGNSAELKGAATALANAAELRSRKLAAMTIDRDRAQDFLKHLAQTAAAEDVDYDSARQFVWAYERTHARLVATTRPVGSQEPPTGSAVPTEWIGGNPILKELDESLILWLPRNRTDRVPVEIFVGDQRIDGRTQLPVDIGRALQKSAAYHPKPIRAAFQELQQLPPTTTAPRK